MFDWLKYEILRKKLQYQQTPENAKCKLLRKYHSDDFRSVLTDISFLCQCITHFTESHYKVFPLCVTETINKQKYKPSNK